MAWCAWATLSLLERPTYGGVRQIIDREAPYLRDRQRIMKTLEIIETKFVATVDVNTRAIVKLETTLEHLLEVRPAEVLEEVRKLQRKFEDRMPP